MGADGAGEALEQQGDLDKQMLIISLVLLLPLSYLSSQKCLLSHFIPLPLTS